MLDVSTRTLNRWVEDGNIQYVKTGTGRYRFLESELKRILADTRYSLKSINPCAPSEFGVCGRASDARDRGLVSVVVLFRFFGCGDVNLYSVVLD